MGGLIGYALDIEGGILKFGEALKRLVPGSKNDTGGFAQGFLAASVLFCVGAMSILGSFQAGAEGKMDIILIKSVMDGCMAVILTGALGIGVGFSAVSILVYQGALTLAAVWVKPWVDVHPLVLSEISGVGGPHGSDDFVESSGAQEDSDGQFSSGFGGYRRICPDRSMARTADGRVINRRVGTKGTPAIPWLRGRCEAALATTSPGLPSL